MSLVVQQGTAPDDPFAVFIMGATATGKTELALALAAELPMDIISVDSAMVYRGLDIGSAKPDAQTLAESPHRLIDICDPAESYSAGRFRDDALAEMAQITAADRIPLLAGGTMLYFRALQQGIAELPAADRDIRQKLDEEARSRGWEYMHQRLAKIDPLSAQRIHPNDPQRIQRALEVFEISGKTLTDFWRDQSSRRLAYRRVKIALMPSDRVELRKAIAQRLDAMIDQGLIEEVKRLYQRKDLHSELPAIRAVGYRQVWAMLGGEYDFKTMREKAIIATAQLAKRQMTWLRKEPDCNFIEPGSVKLLNLLKNLGNLL
ncbi:MAG: tRNA (adenosine(37)-N6)-dimethylallyltransferase MiaA [Gammaproteobacteria bacterium]|jgi:tRNA dimethylallyltransferase